DYRQKLEDLGLVASGISPDGRLVETIEIPEHPFFIGVQFHPEFKSRPNKPHPLFRGFIGAAFAKQKDRDSSGEKGDLT
ncbi:MAG: gamma-glutamyl-gamma-aminobutyrate hydrolase family protein, partial [Lachnospiraceae bacterium]|nr:gamma-glutamyl-gamma-aminobutyrate hydrolase family protein [Lachnospiraceae bacterium]